MVAFWANSNLSNSDDNDEHPLRIVRNLNSNKKARVIRQLNIDWKFASSSLAAACVNKLKLSIRFEGGQFVGYHQFREPKNSFRL